MSLKPKDFYLNPLFSHEDQHTLTIIKLMRMFFRAINIKKDRKNWIYFFNFLTLFLSSVGALIFAMNYFSFGLFIFSMLYAMFVLNIYGTLYYHRYCSHQVYKVSNNLSHWVIKLLAPRLFSEEVFLFAHLTHHKYADTEYDPHNPKSGWLFCFLADFTQMRTETQMSKDEYFKALSLFRHVSIKKNSYEEYLKWGTLTKPYPYILEVFLSWLIWSLIFYLIGGVHLLFAFYLGCFFWGVFARNFNYKAHGGGEDKRLKNRDFDIHSISLNLWLPGLTAGEWHNNHHICPRSANNGFKKNQVDLTFLLIKLLKKIGIINHYNDHQEEFFKKYPDAKGC